MSSFSKTTGGWRTGAGGGVGRYVYTSVLHVLDPNSTLHRLGPDFFTLLDTQYVLLSLFRVITLRGLEWESKAVAKT